MYMKIVIKRNQKWKLIKMNRWTSFSFNIIEFNSKQKLRSTL